MNKPATYNLIFNAIGALVGLVVVGYVVYSAVLTESVPSCTESYPTPTRLALKAHDGTLLSPIELQARGGLREWGVTSNAKVVDDPKAPGGAALQVQLANVAVNETSNDRPANGVYFRWTPTGMATAKSACLSYRVWLPEGFEFSPGGILPGLFGGIPAAEAEQISEQTSLGSRIQWRRDGEGNLDVAMSGSSFRQVNQPGFALRPGSWTRIDQEIVLNTPGTADGEARMWVDGSLKAEALKLQLRATESERIAGVLADIGYVRAPAKPGMLRLSPFDLSWR